MLLTEAGFQQHFKHRKHPEDNGLQEAFEILHWRGFQNKSIEQVQYYSSYDTAFIKGIEYEGWRRHVEKRRSEEGIRIILRVETLKTQIQLARLIDEPLFKRIGWIEPIRMVMGDLMLIINFRENEIENHPDYIDNLFEKISQIETIPYEIIEDLKCVIAFNGAQRFMDKMIEEGLLL